MYPAYHKVGYFYLVVSGAGLKGLFLYTVNGITKEG